MTTDRARPYRAAVPLIALAVIAAYVVLWLSVGFLRGTAYVLAVCIPLGLVSIAAAVVKGIRKRR